jgi:hypothetical protein
MVSQDTTMYWLNKKINSKLPSPPPWRTFKYMRIPFGLMNVGSTFQREMEFSFRYLIGNIIETYHDELNVVSKERSAHIEHDRKVFEWCRNYGISINPKM